jgi:hypothetical protein
MVNAGGRDLEVLMVSAGGRDLEVLMVSAGGRDLGVLMVPQDEYQDPEPVPSTFHF